MSETEEKKKRIVVFVASLGSGGAERVAVRVCGWLRDVGHEVLLLTLSGTSTDFYAYPKGVARLALDMQQASRNPAEALFANVRRLLAVRRAVRAFHADAALSLGDRTNVLMLLALVGLRCRKVISERADPVLEPLSRGWNLLRRLVYPMASLHVSQSSYVSDWIGKRFPRLPCVVIGNTGGQHSVLSVHITQRQADENLRLIAVGRLTWQKGFDLLLLAFAKARTEIVTPMTLSIVGEGGDRSALDAQAKQLGLDDAVTFHGRLPDVQARLQASDVFVLSSRWEGFPNVMIEAMSAGLPVVAARCRGGVEDVLGDVPEQYALEYPPGNVDALAECIVRMAVDMALRNRLERSAMNRAADYSQEKIAAAWRNAVDAE